MNILLKKTQWKKSTFNISINPAEPEKKNRWNVNERFLKNFKEKN